MKLGVMGLGYVGSVVAAGLDSADYDALGVEVAWPEIADANWRGIADAAEPPRLLFDGRNVLDAVRMHELGFDYRGVGRGRAAPTRIPYEQAH